jgi:prepilin-type N-terminal cleavage/methylation domain-containing protein
MHPRPAQPRRARSGFTLTESLIASVVLAAAGVGVLSMVNASYAQASHVREDAAALALAGELAEEIAAVPWAAVVPTDAAGNPLRSDAAGWPVNGNRGTYDNVGDFDGYADATTALSSQSGIAVAAAAGGKYKRQVTIVSSPIASIPTPADMAVVQVKVTTPTGRTVTLSRLVARGDTGRVGG